ncbi:MAG: hypothetical protein IKH71_06025 [Oscillospiraceae bacterium]|nr:hypothetical protein [Oscillospiraceae bacterium]
MIKRDRTVNNRCEDPNVDIARDVFKDRAIGTIARLGSLITNNMGLDLDKDTDNPAVKIYRELCELERNAYRFDTLEEIDKAEERLREIKKYCGELREELA